MEGYLPGAECAQCQGRCCKEKGCSLAPEDFKRALIKADKSESIAKTEGSSLQNPEEWKRSILNLLQQPDNLYAIDYFTTKEGPLFYLRMRHKCYTFIGVDAMGECAALTEKGCSLSEEDRPKGGRFLKSEANGNCVQHYTKEMMEKDWAPYREILKSIWIEYEKKLKEDGTFDKCDADYFAWMRSKNNK